MKKKHYLLAGLLALVAIAWLLVEQGGTLKAAGDYKIKIGSEQTAGTTDYIMKRKTVKATYTDSKGDTPVTGNIKWDVSDKSVLSINGADNATQVDLKAEGAGTVELSAVITYTDVDGKDKFATATRTIIVGYAVDEEPKNGFTQIKELSNESIMVLKVDDQGTLDFIFPAVGKLPTWESTDTKVVSMLVDPSKGDISEERNTSGNFRAVGTGKAQIKVTYTNAENKLDTIYIDVYVGPDVTYMTSDGTSIGSSISVKKGDLIYTGAILKDTPYTINQRVEWSVIQEKELVGDSQNPAGLIATSIYNPYLTVDARAGTYQVGVYTIGAYQKKVTSDILCKYFEMKVKAACRDYTNTNAIYLQVGDVYDIAEVFNMTVKDFNECFEVTTADTPKRFDYLDGNIIANSEGKQNIEIKLKAQMASKLQELMDDSSISEGQTYKLELNIYDSFHLDRTSVDLAVGARLKLQPLYGILGKITWTSEDESFVKVDQNGIITGVKETSGSVKVTASMKLPDGRVLKASCAVTVHKTAEEIKLSTTNLRLQLGQSSTIVASFMPTTITEIPGLQWLLTDDEIVSLDVNSKKSVIVTAKKAGTTILTAVNEDNYVSAYCTITVLSPITNISLQEGEELVLKLSQEAVKFHPEYDTKATDTKLKWSSSNTAVAKVDETGFTQLLSAGTTVITVIPEWNPHNVMAQCRLTVIQSATAFALNKHEITLEMGEKEKLEPAVKPDKAESTITWKSLNSKVATVNADGTVTAVAAGQAYIVANTENGFVDNCLVTVTQKASGIKLDNYNITINVGESYTVTATPNPATSTEKKFTWTSKEPSIATVKDGTVTGVSAGSTIILVKTKSGDVAYLYVTVKDKAKGMELNYPQKTIAKGDSFTLKPIFTPANTTNKKVTFTTSNSGVAKVNEKGKVTGVKGGSAIITAVSEDGGYVANCLVTVVQPVSKIKLNHTSYKLGLGKTVTLKASVTSNTSSNPKVKWTSSNTKIATVSSSGKVKAKKLGTCTITAKVTDGSGKKATCKITVVRQVTGIKLNRAYLTLVTGRNYRLKATVKPSNATYKTVKWSSTDSSVAQVKGNGLVRGMTVGSCNIKASAKDNSKKSSSCYVEVIEPIAATSVVLSSQNMVMIRGESQMLSYSLVPSNTTDSVKITSTNKNIATVSSTGKVYARRAGSTSITITTDSGKQAVIQLQVIGLNKTSIVLEQYDTETIYVDGVSSGISWYSKNPSVATVVNGKIVGRKKGTTTIYAKVNGITLGCKVKVKSIS